jgi:hypothetical protein
MYARLLFVAVLAVAAGPGPELLLAQAKPRPGIATRSPAAERRTGLTLGGFLGPTVGFYEADTANTQYVATYSVGFQFGVALWLRRVVGIRMGAGVDFFRGPEDQNGHPAHGSYGVADIALALRTPQPRERGFSFGVDLGTAAIFESTYSYSYQDGDVVFVTGDIELPLRGGPYVEASVRRGGLVGWQLAYRQFFNASSPTEGRMKGRLMLVVSVGR